MKIRDILTAEIKHLTSEIGAEKGKLSRIPEGVPSGQAEIIKKKLLFLENELEMAKDFLNSHYADYDVDDCVKREKWLLRTIAKVTARDLAEERYLREAEGTIFLIRFLRELLSHELFVKNPYLINSFRR